MSAQRFVLDTSVVMAWCFKDERNAYTEAVRDSLETTEAVVPAIWPLEVGNVLLVAERKSRLSHADSVRFVTLINALPIKVEQEPSSRMFEDIMALARDQHLSTYDACYLDLAMRQGLPLASQDKALLHAAKKCKAAVHRPE